MTGLGLLHLGLGSYLAAALLAARRRARRATPALSLSSIVLTVLGLGLHLAFVVLRAAATGFLPFASRFEALVLFALAVQATGLVVYSTTRQNSVKAGTDLLSTALLAGAILPVGFHPVTELNPMLDSPWFAVHILAAFCGYGCFSAGLVWSLVHLFDRTLDAAPAVPRRLALSGLFLLGTGILTGAAWADSAWGTYWNWDPKESWALLTWSIMLVYVHHRSGRLRDVLFFGLTFVAMMFTFVGINLLKWGLHRY